MRTAINRIKLTEVILELYVILGDTAHLLNETFELVRKKLLLRRPKQRISDLSLVECSESVTQ
jgi:hypothetical protein